MISRYALYDTSKLTDRFAIADGLPKGIKPHYNYSPTATTPVIVNEQGSHSIKPMKWGFIAQGAKDANSVFRYKTYNIPSEKILSKHSWERAVREHRGLVPANGFYYEDPQTKQAFYTHAKDNGLLAFAGVYGTWQDPAGVNYDTFSLITITSSKSGIRMPVILSIEDEARWLDPAINDTSSLYDMLRLYDEDSLHTHGVASATNSPKQNHPGLIEKIT